MKNILLTTSLLAASIGSAYAQSTWTAGEEITDKVTWDNLSFTSETIAPWVLKQTGGNTTETGGLCEVYNGKDVDLYQIVQLPAGMYRLECQGYYRCGNSWADDPSLFNTENWEDNALLYVSNGSYDIESEAFTVGRTFSTPLMPRLFDKQFSQIYEDTVKEGWDMSDGNYTVGDESLWGPCSVPGSLMWFEAGKYMPYVSEDDDDVKYNTVTFFLTQDGYVKVGVSKDKPREADSFMATNFKLFYEGTADEAAELMAAREDVKAYEDKIDNLKTKYEDVTLGCLFEEYYTLEYDEKISGSIKNFTKAQCDEALAILKPMYEQFVQTVADYEAFQSLVNMSKLLNNSTDYNGKAEFEKILADCDAYLDMDKYADVIGDDNTNLNIFSAKGKVLGEARMAYVMSQEPENGAYNFSFAINQPFLVNNEYTPTWSAEDNCYKFINEIEETWATVQEKSYKEVLDEHTDWLPICSDVQFTQDDNVEGQWVYNTTMWHGNGFNGRDAQHGYIGAGAWSAEPTGNPEKFYQTITNLPNGFYSMSGLMCNAGADVSENQYVFIEAGDKVEKANLTQKGNPWWGGNRDQWRQTVWQKLTTNMIYVSDGKAKIGARSDAFYSTTGFQLYYYGETPDFAKILGPSLETVRTRMATLTLPGDKAKVDELYAQIPNVSNTEEYEKALEVIEKINKYVDVANSAANNWGNTLDQIGQWSQGFPESSDEAIISGMYAMDALSVGEGEADTYEVYGKATDLYNAYVKYITFLQIAKETAGLNTNSTKGKKISANIDELKAALADAIVKQVEDLKANLASVEKLDNYLTVLAAPYNNVIIASLGGATATEAKPVDVTALIINPSFAEGNKGWNGAFTAAVGVENKTTNGESYETESFDINQTIKALPKGAYTIVVDAFYRDGSISDAYKNWFNAGGDIDSWETGNVALYASTASESNETKVKSIAVLRSTTVSMEKYVDGQEEDAEATDLNGGVIVYKPIWKEINWEKIEHPFDSSVKDELEDVTYYFPNSTRGADAIFSKENDDTYTNKVTVYVQEGQDLTFGLRKNLEKKLGQDWCIFDNFKLYYLGEAVPTSIANLDANSLEGATIYSVDGVRQNKLTKGINIVKTSNGETHKVLVK